jgi:hypothetical protein
MIGRDGRTSRASSHTRAPIPARYARVPVPVSPFPPPIARSPLPAAGDSPVLHSTASLIVHARLDARNGVACSAINGTLRFSIGHLPADEFIRSLARARIPPNRAIGLAEAGVPRLVLYARDVRDPAGLPRVIAAHKV